MQRCLLGDVVSRRKRPIGCLRRGGSRWRRRGGDFNDDHSLPPFAPPPPVPVRSCSLASPPIRHLCRPSHERAGATPPPRTMTPPTVPPPTPRRAHPPAAANAHPHAYCDHSDTLSSTALPPPPSPPSSRPPKTPLTLAAHYPPPPPPPSSKGKQPERDLPSYPASSPYGRHLLGALRCASFLPPPVRSGKACRGQGRIHSTSRHHRYVVGTPS